MAVFFDESVSLAAFYTSSDGRSSDTKAIGCSTDLCAYYESGILGKDTWMNA